MPVRFECTRTGWPFDGLGGLPFRRTQQPPSDDGGARHSGRADSLPEYRARKRQAVARRGSFQPGRTKWQV